MFTANELITFVIAMLGMPYWYGCVVYPCTESRLKSKTKQYPAHYGESRMSTYRKHIEKRLVCMDCVGMIKGFFWTNGGKGIVEYINGGNEYVNKYASNGCPDKSANGMLSWCKSQGCKWGKIATLPETPGALVFLDGHVGVYIGNGYVVEARGFKYGVVKTKLSERPWKHWALLPASLIKYDGAVEYQLGDRLLKNGSVGDDVAELQKRLNALGFDCGKVDGEFGKRTQTALEAFQTASDIGVDGEFGKESLKALKAAEGRSVEEIADEVIDGKWGNGSERRKRLEAAGYNYREVQNKVNELLKG